MTTKIKKTTTVRTSIVWKAIINDDDSNPIATVIASFDNGRPLGSYELSVNNRDLYDANTDSVSEEYDAIVANFKAEINGVEAFSSTTESD